MNNKHLFSDVNNEEQQQHKEKDANGISSSQQIRNSSSPIATISKTQKKATATINASTSNQITTASATAPVVSSTTRIAINKIPIFMDISNAIHQIGLVKQILKKATTDWLLADEILYLLQFGEMTMSQSPVPQCPPNGSVWYYDRRKISDFRKDGYSWKKKKGSSFSVREDHVKLKVGKEPRIYGMLSFICMLCHHVYLCANITLRFAAFLKNI